MICLQSEAAECGLACLAMVAGHHGHEVDLRTLRRRHGLSLKGANLAQLMQIAGAMQLSTRALKLGLGDLGKLRLPCVLHWDFHHFVVLSAVKGKTVTVLDPAVGERTLPLAEVGDHFTGVALELTPTPGFVQEVEKTELPIWKLWQGSTGKARAYTHIFVLALALQVFALLMPLFLQLAIDQVLPAGDRNLLATLGIGFLLLVLVQTATEVLRGTVVAQLGARLNFQMASNLLYHLLRLPVGFFERRHLGDVISRFGSLDAIQRSLTTGFVEALVDGVMILLTLLLMLLYSPALTALAAAAVLAYGLGRWLLFSPLREANFDALSRQARQESHFLESVRGIQALKLFDKQAERHADWQNLFVGRLNAELKVARLGVGFNGFRQGLFGLLAIGVVWLGVREVLAGGFSIGMLSAFLAYNVQFSTKAASFIERLIEFRMLGLHGERIADIALEETEPEPVAAGFAGATLPADGLLEVRGLSYCYAPLEPLVFQGQSFTVTPGRCLVLAGPSGCGKTTLLKVLLGLLPATEGTVSFAGHPLAAWGAAWRENIGVVMQEDSLFAGSIADNIAFGDTRPDMAKVVGAAQLAAVHEDIVKLPMAYNTLVGDMGSSLSGGQKQRVFLARALYRQPRVLFLDEASSHLDVAAEARINVNLAQLGITRVVVAHRPETIAAGDAVHWVGGVAPAAVDGAPGQAGEAAGG